MALAAINKIICCYCCVGKTLKGKRSTALDLLLKHLENTLYLSIFLESHAN